MNADRPESLIEYPCDFPIKVMGDTGTAFVEAVVFIAKCFDPTFSEERSLTSRVSTQGRYQSLTLTIRATSREQLDEIYRTLSTHPLVKVTL
jgi:putative lipoic acid-binding regulatory protein